MEERHLHCSLRTSLQLRRIKWGNKGLLWSLWPMALLMPREGVLWPLLPITYPDRGLVSEAEDMWRGSRCAGHPQLPQWLEGSEGECPKSKQGPLRRRGGWWMGLPGPG